jgi:tetratricopeptide (TPR) repeat protein
MARLLSVAALSLILLVSACSSRSKEMKNAETYMQVNELGKAKELLDLEIQTNPKNAEAYVMLAKVFLLGGDLVDARAAFDKALLLDTGTKSEISRTYFEAAQGLAEKKGDQGSVVLISAYLQEATTLDPDLNGRVVDWAIKRAKAESSADKTTAPVALLQAAAKAAPDSRDRISDALLETAKAYLDRQFLREAAVYATEAGEQSPSKLNEASSVLRSACTLLPAQDREYARGCLEKAMQWNPALANDDDVYWLTRAGLKADGASAVSDYLAKFPSGKHASDAKSILGEEARAPHWVRVSQGQNIPSGAIQTDDGGRAGYICRGPYAGGIHPGEVVAGNCNIGYGGKEIFLPSYEVGVGSGAWGAQGRQGPLVGGREGDGELLVCRASIDGAWHGGKVFKGRQCNVGFGGAERIAPSYELFYPTP